MSGSSVQLMESWQRVPREVVESPPWGFPAWTWSAVGVPAGAGLGPDGSEVPANLNQSVILWRYQNLSIYLLKYMYMVLESRPHLFPFQ